MTNASRLGRGDAYTVAVPGKAMKRVAQITRIDPALDCAILKVNGLNLPALTFLAAEPELDAVVCSAARLNDAQGSIGLSKGRLLDACKLVVDNIWDRHRVCRRETSCLKRLMDSFF